MIRIALIATFIAVASSTLAHAECVQLNVATVARYADAVFSGRITDADGSTITFEVDRVWKGPVTKRFTVYRVNSVEAFQPAVGSEYLVFARRASDNEAFDAKDRRRAFVIGQCGGGTRLWEHVGPKEIKALGRGRSPRRNLQPVARPN